MKHLQHKVPLHSVLFYIGIFFFAIGKCLSHGTQYEVNNKNLQRQTTYGRLSQKLNFVAMATAHGDAFLVY